MYSVEEIKELLRAFDASKATRLEIIGENGQVLTIAQKSCRAVVSEPAVVTPIYDAPVEKVPAAPFIHEEEKQENEGTAVTSPMVGVFYAAPSPDQEPYVSVGTKVNKGDVLCLVEAMKLMNEVQSEFDGVVERILVTDGQAVEYDQPIMIIK